jgi:hypothetical protein
VNHLRWKLHAEIREALNDKKPLIMKGTSTISITVTMDADDELTRMKFHALTVQRALDRATDQLLNMHKRIDELEAALKVKLF